MLLRLLGNMMSVSITISTV